MPRSTTVPVAKVLPDEPERRRRLSEEQAAYFAGLLDRLKDVPLPDPVEFQQHVPGGASPVVSSPLGFVDEEKLRTMVRAAGIRGGVDVVRQEETRRKRAALERLAPEYRAFFEVARLEDTSTQTDVERRLATAETSAAEWLVGVHAGVHELFGEALCSRPGECTSSRANIRRHGAETAGLAATYKALWHDLEDPAWVPPEGESGLPEVVHALREWGCTFRDIAFIRLWLLGRRPVQAEELRLGEGAAKKAAEVHKRRLEALRKRLLGPRYKPASEKRTSRARNAKLTPKTSPTKRR